MVVVQNKPFRRPIGSFIKKAHKDPIPYYCLDERLTVLLATSSMLEKIKRRVLFRRDSLLGRHFSEPALFPRLEGEARDQKTRAQPGSHRWKTHENKRLWAQTARKTAPPRRNAKEWMFTQLSSCLRCQTLGTRRIPASGLPRNTKVLQLKSHWNEGALLLD